MFSISRAAATATPLAALRRKPSRRFPRSTLIGLFLPARLHSFGAISSLYATDTKTPGAHDTESAGLCADYPSCYDNVEFSAPTIVLIGEKDDWTPAKLCQAVQGKPNLEKVAVFPGAFHGFVMPMGEPFDYLGHHIAFDVKLWALDAQQAADAFLAKHLK